MQRSLLRPLHHKQFPFRVSIRRVSDARPFQAKDYVLLKQLDDRLASPVLRGPLKPGKRIDTHKGNLRHDDIIGKRVRDVVQVIPPKSGKPAAEYRLFEVRLDDYVRLSRRLVTPIYPADANLIVSLLDLHPEVYDPAGYEEGEPKLEILEAGTGHGALTLYLSRAIHGANPRKPSAPTPLAEDSEATEEESASDNALVAWKSRRRALIHTIDISPRYSSHAQQTVSAFRQGLYADNIDFHTGDVSEWLAHTLPVRGNEPFLSHAFLDLPNADTHLANVAGALRVDGTLVVFNPSITQITDCALKVKKDGIPLELERVVELGVNGGTGGREWDVRPVQPRAGRRAVRSAASESTDDSATEIEAAEDNGVGLSRDEEQNGGQEAQTETVGAKVEEAKWSMVCRPKVGDRVIGGGFLGVWKRRRD